MTTTVTQTKAIAMKASTTKKAKVKKLAWWFTWLYLPGLLIFMPIFHAIGYTINPAKFAYWHRLALGTKKKSHRKKPAMPTPTVKQATMAFKEEHHD